MAARRRLHDGPPESAGRDGRPELHPPQAPLTSAASWPSAIRLPRARPSRPHPRTRQPDIRVAEPAAAARHPGWLLTRPSPRRWPVSQRSRSRGPICAIGAPQHDPGHLTPRPAGEREVIQLPAFTVTDRRRGISADPDAPPARRWPITWHHTHDPSRSTTSTPLTSGMVLPGTASAGTARSSAGSRRSSGCMLAAFPTDRCSELARYMRRPRHPVRMTGSWPAGHRSGIPGIAPRCRKQTRASNSPFV